MVVRGREAGASAFAVRIFPCLSCVLDAALGPLPVGGRTVLVKVDLLEHLENVLMPQLENPHRPAFCPECFLFYIGCLIMPCFDQTSAHLLVHRHDFFDACIAFLVTQRTMDDLPVLRKQFHDNKARCSTRDWHYFTPNCGDDPLALVLTAIFTFLTTGMSNLKNKGWFKSKARKGTWPTAPEQLLPRGPLLSTAAYVFWCRTLISAYAIPTLIGLLEVARTDVLPHLHVPPQKDRLVETLIVMLSGDRARAPPSFWLSKGEGLLSQQTAAAFLSTVLHGHGAKLMDDMGLLCRGHERALYPALIAALDADVVRDETHLFALASAASAVHERLGLPASARHERMLWHLDQVGLPADVTLGVQLVYMILHARASSKVCAASGCSAPGKQACSRCQFVAYCGRDCQRDDWKNGWRGPDVDLPVPHKVLCPILCGLFDADVRVERRTIGEFVNAYRAANVPAAHEMAIISWGVSAGLVPKTILKDIFGVGSV